MMTCKQITQHCIKAISVLEITLLSVGSLLLSIPLYPNVETAYAMPIPGCFVSTGAGNPTITPPGPIEAMRGEDFTFQVALTNGGSAAGYAPYIDFILPADVTVNSASFTIGGVSVSPVAPSPYTGSGTVTHPYTGLDVAVPEDQTFYVYNFPFGSFVPDQPAARIQINATMPEETPYVNLATQMQAGCGFGWGADEFNNPSTDPALVGASNTYDWMPILIIPEKELMTIEGENETVTGENWPVTYQLNADIASGATLPLVLTDVLPPEFQLISIDSQLGDTGAGFTVTFTPTIGSAQTSSSLPFTPIGPFPPGGTVEISYNSVTGSSAELDAQLEFTIYVPEFYEDGTTPILDPVTGVGTVETDNLVDNDYDASAIFEGTTYPSTSPIETLEILANATQKSVANTINAGPAGYSPGDILTYTVEFEISDYFALDDINIEDIMGDGLEYVAASASASVQADGVTTAVAFTPANITNEANAVTSPTFDFTGPDCAGCTQAITYDNTSNGDAIDPPADGETHIAYDISEALIDAGLSGILEGGLIGPTTVGEPTKLTLTYQAEILDSFFGNPAVDPSVDAYDTLSNEVSIFGDVASGPTPGTQISETSETTIRIVATEFGKSIGAMQLNSGVDAAPFGNPDPQTIAAGNVVVFSLLLDIPSGDADTLVIEDFLPLPVFDASAFSLVFDNTIYNPTDGSGSSIPAPNTVAYGSSSTGFTMALPTPTITTNATTNSVTLTYASGSTFQEDPSDGSIIEILLAAEVTGNPFGDGLGIINQATYDVGNSDNQTFGGTEIVPFVAGAPEADLYKCVVASDSTDPDVVSTPDISSYLTFNNPPSATPIATHSISTEEIDNTTTGLNNCVFESVDAGDRVTFMIVLENEGSAPAYDLNIEDTLPVGFNTPSSAADLNLRAWQQDGATLTEITGVTELSGGLFGFPLNGGTGAGGNTTIAYDGPLVPFDNIAGGANPEDQYDTGNGLTNEGENIIMFTYELVVAQSAEAGGTYSNSAVLNSFSSTIGGPNFVGEPAVYESSASILIDGASMVKLDSEHPDGVASTTPNNYTVGEKIRYELAITMPEGTTTGVTIVDNIPNGLAYFGGSGVVLDTTCDGGGTAFNGIVPTPSIVPAGAGLASQGADVTITFPSAITTANDNDVLTDTFCLYYDVVVLNTAGNVGATRTNSAVLSYSGTTLPAVNIPIDVVGPDLTVTKAVSPSGSAEAGDTLTYTITIAHSGTSSADAYDINVSDLISNKLIVNDTFASDGRDNDGDTVADSGDAEETAGGFFVNGGGGVGGTFTWNNTTTNNPLFNHLPIGSDITLQFEVTVGDNVSPTEVIGNDASITYDSLPGDPDAGLPEAEGSGTGSTSTTILNITAGKATSGSTLPNTGSAQHTAGLLDIAIGEQVFYDITLAVPESELTNLVIVDSLPNFMRADSAIIVQNDIGSTGSIILSDAQNGDSINDTYTITFPTVNNPPDADIEFIVVRVFATLLDNAGNSNGQVKTNQITVDWNENNGSALTDSVGIDVVEPDLVITKTMSPSPIDAGDQVLITINVDHSTASTMDAFDMVVTDTIPTAFTAVTTFSSDGLDNDGDGLIDGADVDEINGPNIFFTAPNQYTFTGAILTLANDITYQFYATVNANAYPQQVIANTGSLAYDSAPGNNPDEADYTDEDNDSVTVRDINFTKSIFSTSNVDTGTSQLTALTDVLIGETVTYHLTLEIPETEIQNLVVTDVLPPMLEAISGSVIQDDTGDISSPGITFTDVTPADGVNETTTFNLGAVDNASGSGPATVILAVQALVVDNAVNDNADIKTNTATLTHSGQVVPLMDSASVEVVEPNLTIVKSVTPDPAEGDGGDPFTFTVTVQNIGTGPAYDLEITDTLNAQFNLTTPLDADGLDNDGDGIDSNSGETTAAFYNAGGNNFTWNNTTTGLPNYNTLMPGAGFSVTYNVTLDNSVSFGDVLENTADLNYDATPGAGGRTGTGSDMESVAVNTTGSLLKTLTGSNSSPSIGDTLTYQVTIEMPEGTNNPFTLTDSLPAGLVYIPGTAAVTSNKATLTWSGTPEAPVETPSSATIGAGVAQVLTFGFGTGTNLDVANASADLITLTYDVLVMNTTDNNLGNTKINSATLNYGAGGTAGPASSPVVTIAEPVINITKTTSYSSGSNLTYVMSIVNSGTATGYDLSINDIIPDGLTYANGYTLLTGATLPTLTEGTSGSNTLLTFELSELGPSQVTTWSFDLTIDTDVIPATVITNTGSLTYSSQDGNPGEGILGNSNSDERDGSEDAGSDDHNDDGSVAIAVVRPLLDVTKTVVDLTSNSGAEINDLLEYTIVLTNLGNGVGTEIDLLDNVPANLTGFTITEFPASGTDFSTATGGTNETGIIDFRNITLDANGGLVDTITIKYQAQIAKSLVPGTLIDNEVTVTPPTEGGPGDSDDTSLTVIAPVLNLEKFADKEDAKIGEVVTYTLILTNTGTSVSTNTVVQDPILPYMTYVPNSLTLSGVSQTDIQFDDIGHYDATGSLVVFNWPSFPVGFSGGVMTFQVTLDANTPNGTVFTNTAAVTDDQGSFDNASTDVDGPEDVILGPSGGSGTGGGGSSGGSSGGGGRSIVSSSSSNSSSSSSSSSSSTPVVSDAYNEQQLERFKDNWSQTDVLPKTGFVPDWLRSNYDAFSIFPDVNANDTYYEGLVFGLRQEIFSGYPDGTMRPENTIIRAEMAKVIAVAMEHLLKRGLSAPSFSDVEKEQWYYDYVTSLADSGFINGYPDKTYRPANEVSLGEVAALIAKGFELSGNAPGDDWKTYYWDVLNNANLIPKSLQNANLDKNATRGEVAEIIRRAAIMKDMSVSAYPGSVSFSIPAYGVSAEATSSLVSDSSVWVDDLTNAGIARYWDDKNQRLVLWGHSSVWPGDPKGPILQAVRDEPMALGEIVVYDGVFYEAISHESGIDEYYVEAIDFSDSDVDLVLFTCDKDIQYRNIVKMKRVE